MLALPSLAGWVLIALSAGSLPLIYTGRYSRSPNNTEPFLRFITVSKTRFYFNKYKHFNQFQIYFSAMLTKREILVF